jgi:hypothetical protein
MFWGAFSWHRRTSLIALLGDPNSTRGGVTGSVILECLKAHLETVAEPGSIFIQDNAPVHMSHLV